MISSAVAELKAKFPKVKFNHSPKTDCKYCDGKGWWPSKKDNRDHVCICTFVDHDFSDLAGEALGKAAKKMLNDMNAKEST